jgi:pre-mRNA-splicing factor ATP-dependent RNA helicase DHX15/PRP43
VEIRDSLILNLNMSNGKAETNPYLQRVNLQRVNPRSTTEREPLFGWVPRRVKGDDVRKVLVNHLMNCCDICFSIFFQEGDINPFTKQTHSPQYKKILEARKKLPVYAQMDEFLKIVSNGDSHFEEGFETTILSDRPTLCQT